MTCSQCKNPAVTTYSSKEFCSFHLQLAQRRRTEAAQRAADTKRRLGNMNFSRTSPHRKGIDKKRQETYDRLRDFDPAEVEDCIANNAHVNEQDVQNLIKYWCDVNGVKYLDCSHKNQMLGVGHPDLVIQFVGSDLYVEVKGTRGYLSPEQERWHREYAELGPIVTGPTKEIPRSPVRYVPLHEVRQAIEDESNYWRVRENSQA